MEHLAIGATIPLPIRCVNAKRAVEVRVFLWQTYLLLRRCRQILVGHGFKPCRNGLANKSALAADPVDVEQVSG
jgi:hypothetical protein